MVLVQFRELREKLTFANLSPRKPGFIVDIFANKRSFKPVVIAGVFHTSKNIFHLSQN